MAEARRVAFVIDGALDQPTGGYLYDKQVIAGLRARGFVVDVLSLRADRSISLLTENARVLRLLQPSERAYDVVIIDELCHPRTALAALLRPSDRRAPLLVTLLHHLAASERRGLRAEARLVIERALLHASDRVIVTSETTAQIAHSIGIARDRVFVARPGRDRLGQTDAVRDADPQKPVRLLFLGAMTARKDPLSLLAAFEAVSAHAQLTLAGPLDRDARYAARVLAQASRYGDRVRVTGAVEDHALAELFRQHDVFVLPSHYEGFGIALAEAASFGLAIVSCRAGAISEVMPEGAHALLVEPGDVPALAAALRRLVSDGASLAQRKRAAHRRALALPTWSETQALFASAIEGLLAEMHAREQPPNESA